MLDLPQADFVDALSRLIQAIGFCIGAIGGILTLLQARSNGRKAQEVSDKVSYMHDCIHQLRSDIQNDRIDDAKVGEVLDARRT